MKIFFAALFVSVSVAAQTLQHHLTSPTLQPESCRDHVARTRHEFIDATQWTHDQEFKENLNIVYVRTGDPNYVAHICSNNKIIGYYNVLVAIAIYERRENMFGKGAPITH